MNAKNRNLTVLTECSIMIALSTVLSLFKLFEMPYGGSITLCSMLPIVTVAYRHGVKNGLFAGCCTAFMQMLLGLKNFSYFSTWQSLLALAALDYFAAFAVFGLCGIFRKRIKNQSLSLTAGAFFASLLRYICHTISGATVWAGLSIPSGAALVYSLSYNATYMIPETVILLLCAMYFGSAVDLESRIPTRKKSEKLDTAGIYCLIGAGFTMLGALIACTVLVFSKLQNPDSGELDITALAEVNWVAVCLVALIGFVIAAALAVYTKIRSKKK